MTFSALLLLALLAGFLVYPHDIGLSAFLRRIGDLPGDLRRILALSELVAHGSGVVMLLAVVWYLAPQYRLYIPRVAACAFMSGLAANGIKLLHGRIRPIVCPPEIQQSSATWRGWFPGVSDNVHQPYEYAVQSFPSAHTATAIGFAIGMSWLYPRGRILFYSVAVFAGLQRIVFLAHWPSDVIFGAATGILFGACFVLPGTIGNSMCTWLEQKSRLGRRLQASTDAELERIEPSRRAA